MNAVYLVFALVDMYFFKKIFDPKFSKSYLLIWLSVNFVLFIFVNLLKG
jgi:hypothetical protein